MHFASVKLSELWKLVGERRSTWRERGEKRRGEGHVFSIWWPGGGNVQVIKYVNM